MCQRLGPITSPRPRHTRQPRRPHCGGLAAWSGDGNGSIRSPGPPLRASRQGALSTPTPSDPSGRVNCLRAGEQREGDAERKTSRAERKHAAHPSPTVHDQTDSRDRLAARSSPVQPPSTSPTARRSPCRPPALGSSYLALGRAPRQGTSAGQRSPCSDGNTHFPLPPFHALVPSLLGVGRLLPGPLKCLNFRSQEHLLSHLAPQPQRTNWRAQLLGGRDARAPIKFGCSTCPLPYQRNPPGVGEIKKAGLL